MLRQLARVERRSCRRQIGRRSDDDLTLLPADRHCDHIVLDDLAQADAGIKSGRDNIELCIGHQNVEPDARIGGQERRQQVAGQEAFRDGGYGQA